MLQHKYKITIAYDGTNYGGWQVQPNTMTIQQRMEECLSIFLKHGVHLTASGRTDAGVHALGQAAHFSYPEEIDLDHFLKASNGLLPDDIRIKSIESVPENFHARYSAKRKTYHYHLFLDPVMNPFRRNYVLHMRRNFDVETLREAALSFVGEHDFTSFANAVARNPIRTLDRLDVVDEEGGVRLEFESQGFLYKMVRNIVGTLIEVAVHKRSKEEISHIFSARDRRKAGRAAPPQGLFLIKVEYESTNGSSEFLVS